MHKVAVVFLERIEKAWNWRQKSLSFEQTCVFFKTHYFVLFSGWFTLIYLIFQYKRYSLFKNTNPFFQVIVLEYQFIIPFLVSKFIRSWSIFKINSSQFNARNISFFSLMKNYLFPDSKIIHISKSYLKATFWLILWICIC